MVCGHFEPEGLKKTLVTDEKSLHFGPNGGIGGMMGTDNTGRTADYIRPFPVLFFHLGQNILTCTRTSKQI